MRISDWSSDVCSSDLAPERNRLWEELLRAQRRLGTPGDAAVAAYVILVLFEKNNILSRGDESLGSLPVANAIEEMPRSALDLVTRSEEHTSELQSLMRISYAVFCFKQKNAYHGHEQWQIVT